MRVGGRKDAGDFPTQHHEPSLRRSSHDRRTIVARWSHTTTRPLTGLESVAVSHVDTPFHWTEIMRMVLVWPPPLFQPWIAMTIVPLVSSLCAPARGRETVSGTGEVGARGQAVRAGPYPMRLPSSMPSLMRASTSSCQSSKILVLS